MTISYKINNLEHKVIFCKSGKINFISSELDKVNSDKNVLLIYDNKIDIKVLKNIFDELKISGCKVFSIKAKGEKINKNEKFLFA